MVSRFPRAPLRLLADAAVGDGGYQWRARKLKRAQEQADEEGRSLEDVWLDRNGVGGMSVRLVGRSEPDRWARLHVG